MKLGKVDLDHIVLNAEQDFLALKGANIFITGGTGYIGKWLLESFFYANTTLNLKSRVTLLTRDPSYFISSFPHLASETCLDIISGDVRNFTFPIGEFEYVIHAATDVISINPPLEIFDVTLNGTKRVLDFSLLKKVKHFLLLSSGAVYGKIPHNFNRIPETFMGKPSSEDVDSAYGIGKLASEWLGTAYSVNSNMNCKYARVFAQVGPYLPLDKQFVAGNFILNAIKNEDFVVKGDGTPHRSYMYGADLAIWLWAILIRGLNCTAYNVGSDEAISVKDLAYKIASVSGIASPNIKLLKQAISNNANDIYVPDISRAKNDLSLKITIPSEEAFRRTVDWYRPLLKD